MRSVVNRSREVNGPEVLRQRQIFFFEASHFLVGLNPHIPPITLLKFILGV